MLAIERLCAGYGEIAVLHDLDLTVAPGQIVAVLGANGAGKTTLLNTISGLLRPTSGEMTLDGHSLQGIAAERIVRLGLSHVPQGRRIFPGLTVAENLMVARTAADGAGAGWLCRCP